MMIKGKIQYSWPHCLVEDRNCCATHQAKKGAGPPATQKSSGELHIKTMFRKSWVQKGTVVLCCADGYYLVVIERDVKEVSARIIIPIPTKQPTFI